MTVLPPYMNRRRGAFYSAQLEELWENGIMFIPQRVVSP